MPSQMQAEAICSEERAILVLASAGTGKTRILRTRMAYLLQKQRVRSSRILAVTFSQHAAQQLKLRVGALTGPAAVEGAWLGTFHAICCRMLRNHHRLLSLPAGFCVASKNDQAVIVRDIIEKQYKRAGRKGKGRRDVVDEVLRRIQCWKERGIHPRDVAASEVSGKERLALLVYPHYQLQLWQRGLLDFSDLTLGAIRLFREQPQVLAEYRAQFSHILVDELQDTSTVQYEWLRLLFGGCSASPRVSIFCAADDDQSIYGWRGADRGNVQRFISELSDVRVIRMSRSYRCSPHALAAAQALLKHSPSLLPKSAFSCQPSTSAPRVLVRGFWDSTTEANWLAHEIRSRHAAGLPYGEMAVLVRSREMVDALAPALRKAQIPVTMQPPSSGSWWESLEVRCAVAALRLARSSVDDSAAQVLLTHLGLVEKGALARLRERAQQQQDSIFSAAVQWIRRDSVGTSGGASSRLALLIARIQTWQSLAEQGASVSQQLARIVEDYPARDQEGAAALQLLQNCAAKWASLPEFLNQLRQLARIARTERTTETGVFGDCVPLITIHRSKGLEWHTVFLPGWEEGSFPRFKTDSNDEEWRLAYVALTRCSSLAVVSYASRRFSAGSWQPAKPSAFVEALPAANVAAYAPNEARPYHSGLSGFKASSARFFPGSRRGRRVDLTRRVDGLAPSLGKVVDMSPVVLDVSPTEQLYGASISGADDSSSTGGSRPWSSPPDVATQSEGQPYQSRESLNELVFVWTQREGRTERHLEFTWHHQIQNTLEYVWNEVGGERPATVLGAASRSSLLYGDPRAGGEEALEQAMHRQWAEVTDAEVVLAELAANTVVDGVALDDVLP